MLLAISSGEQFLLRPQVFEQLALMTLCFRHVGRFLILQVSSGFFGFLPTWQPMDVRRARNSLRHLIITVRKARACAVPIRLMLFQ